MKIISKSTLFIILAIFTSITISARAESLSSSAVTLLQAAQKTTKDQTKEVYEFDGGKLIGSLNITNIDNELSIIAGGDIAFVFPADHADGYLLMEYETTAEKEVSVKLTQLPLTLTPDEISLDGNPLYIQVGSSKTYVHIDFSSNEKINIKKLEFVNELPADINKNAFILNVSSSGSNGGKEILKSILSVSDIK